MEWLHRATLWLAVASLCGGASGITRTQLYWHDHVDGISRVAWGTGHDSVEILKAGVPSDGFEVCVWVDSILGKRFVAGLPMLFYCFFVCLFFVPTLPRWARFLALPVVALGTSDFAYRIATDYWGWVGLTRWQQLLVAVLACAAVPFCWQTARGLKGLRLCLIFTLSVAVLRGPSEVTRGISVAVLDGAVFSVSTLHMFLVVMSYSGMFGFIRNIKRMPVVSATRTATPPRP